MSKTVTFIFSPQAPIDAIYASYAPYPHGIPAIPVTPISNTKQSKINSSHPLADGPYELNVAFHGTGSVTVDVVDAASGVSLLTAPAPVVCTTINQVYFQV